MHRQRLLPTRRKVKSSQDQRKDMLDKTVPANDADGENMHNAAQDEVEGATILPTTPSNARPANGDFPTLAVGTTVIGRYEVIQVVSDDATSHLYDVIDHQGYQRCWNCASEQNGEGDEFCNDCGAELLNAPYTMHEYPATATWAGCQCAARQHRQHLCGCRSEPM